MRVRAALALLAATLPAGAGAAVLEQVEVSTDPTLSVRLTLSEPAVPAGHALPPGDAAPGRFYVDLPGTTLGPGMAATVNGAGAVLRVRVGQFDRGTTRVVLDLANALPFAVRSAGRIVTIEAERPVAAGAPSPAAPLRVAGLPPTAVSPPPTVTPTVPSLESEAPKPPASSPPPTIARALPPPPLQPPAPSHVGVPPIPVASLPPAASEPAPAATVTPILPSLAAAPSAPAPSSPPPTIAMALPPPAPPPALPAAVPTPSAPAAPVTKPSVARAPKSGPSPVTHHTLVVVDAGHGGRDPGAAGVGGILEKDIVLEFAQLLAVKLTERLPVDIVLTRSDDSFVALNDRLPSAESHTALFLSLHANACSNPELGGMEVFYGGGALRPVATDTPASPQAAMLARFLAAALRAQVGPVRQPRPGPFTVLTHNPAPSALIEIGYLTPAGDAARAQDAGYRDALTDAVVAGVDTYLRATTPQL
jgi:N-acetylmuramoyl-L-alanine amidase